MFLAATRQNSQDPFSRRFHKTSDYHLEKPPPNYGSQGYSAPVLDDQAPRISHELPALRDAPPRIGHEPSIFRDGPTRAGLEPPTFRDGPTRTGLEPPIFRDGPTRTSYNTSAVRDAPPSAGISFVHIVTYLHLMSTYIVLKFFLSVEQK